MDMTFARDGDGFSYNQATEPGSLALLSSECFFFLKRIIITFRYTQEDHQLHQIILPKLSQKFLILQEFLPLLKRASRNDSPTTTPWERAAILNISSLLGSVTESKFKQFYHYSTTKVSLRHRSK